MLARDNPFASDHILRLRYRPQTGDWGEIFSRLETLRYRAAIVGPEGSGKTTLLEDLEPHLLERNFATHWLRLTLQDRKPPEDFWNQPFGPGDVLLFDGAEVLSRPLWWRLQRHTRQSGLLLTAHRPGLLPTLLDTATSPELLTELVHELGESVPDAEPLLKACGGNVREALRRLYFRAAEGNLE